MWIRINFFINFVYVFYVLLVIVLILLFISCLYEFNTYSIYFKRKTKEHKWDELSSASIRKNLKHLTIFTLILLMIKGYMEITIMSKHNESVRVKLYTKHHLILYCKKLIY